VTKAQLGFCVHYHSVQEAQVHTTSAASEASEASASAKVSLNFIADDWNCSPPTQKAPKSSGVGEERGSACTRGAPRAVMRDQLEEALNHQACPEILGGE
jgi:hypothetical protein